MTRGMLRYRYLLLTAWAAAWAVPVYRAHASHVTDYDTLLAGARMMIGRPVPGPHTTALHVYAFLPNVQVGPPPLLLLGGLSWLPNNAGQVVWATLIALCGLLTVRTLEQYAITIGVSARRAAVGVLAAGAAVMAVWAELQHYQHLEDALAIMATTGTALAIVRRRPWWVPALLLGLAAASKPWAAMALPLLFQLPSIDRLRAVAVALVAAAVWWVPFVVAEPHTLSALSALPNELQPQSSLRAVGFTGFMAPQHIRTLEILLGMCLAGLAVSRGRWQAAPLAGFAGRVLLEPRFFLYYGIGPLVAALIWDATCKRRVPVWTLGALTAEFAVPMLLPFRATGYAQLAFGLVTLVVLVLQRPIRARAAEPATA